MPEIQQGHECEDRSDFTELLRWWLESTDEPTVGDVGTFGRAGWVFVQVGTVRCRLNADTARAGVRRFLELVSEHGPDLQWQVTANRNGKVNRIALGPEAEKVQGLYLYSDKEFEVPVSL